ncbi:MAG: 30S ribosomal protein S24e [Candidatus Altiarchaeota archaeon]
MKWKMDVEIIEDKVNPLMGRREVKFILKYEGATPKRPEARKKIVSVLKSDDSLTVLDKLDPSFGTMKASGYVKVYDSQEAMKIEPEYRLKKNFPPAEAKPEGEPSGDAPSAGADAGQGEPAAEAKHGEAAEPEVKGGE